MKFFYSDCEQSVRIGVREEREKLGMGKLAACADGLTQLAFNLSID